MNVSRSLTFLGTPWSIVVAVVAVLVTAGLCFVSWRRSGFRRSMGLLELMRLALVGMVALLLNQPEWTEEFRPTEKPAIAVLADASTSMDTRDAVAGGKVPAQTVIAARGDRAPCRAIDVEHTARANERHHPADFRAPVGTRHRLERASGPGARESRQSERHRPGLRRRLE